MSAAGGAPRPRLLFLAHLLPWPLDGGGQIKSFHTLRILSRRFDVTLLAFVRKKDELDAAGEAALRPLLAGPNALRTILIPRSPVINAVAAARALRARTSFLIGRDAVPSMREAVERALAETNFDAVHVDHLQMAQFVPPGLAARTRVVLDHHNIEHRIPQRLAETPGAANPLLRWYWGREWPKLRDWELAACCRCDRVLVVSDEDKDGLIALAPALAGRLDVVPIGVDTDYFAPIRPWRPGSRTLLSIGTMFWPPNVDSMLHFCADILPKIKKRVPDVKVNIVGARPVKAVCVLGERDPDTIVVTGSVPDVRPYGEDCGAFIVPLRAGSGMRVKILNALAMGLPVVSTSVGAEGIEVTNGENIVLADGAEDFADAVVRVLTEPALAQKIARGGRSLMDARYAWDRVGERLLGVYDTILNNEMAGK
jgi:glycosyltransferase involved in cell wall biosynthesis